MNNMSILVVDDDPKIRKLINANLKERGFSVLEAPNGESAIELMKEGVPNAVIVDLLMPGKDGSEVCLWIREQGLDIPVIVLSAHDEEDLIVNALNAGADDY